MEVDDCECKYTIVKTMMEIFHNKFNEYMSIKAEKTHILDIIDYQHQVDYIVKGLRNKFKSTIDDLKKADCGNQAHRRIADDIVVLKSTADRLFKLFSERKEENEKLKADKISFELPENQLNSPKEEVPVDEQKYNQLEHDYIQLNELMEREHTEYSGEEEYIAKVNEVKSKIQETTKQIRQELVRADKSLLGVECELEDTEISVDKANSELLQAALLKNKRHMVKYPLILGGIFGAAGTIVPGIGNIIGASFGGSLGYAIARLEKKGIRKVEPEKHSTK